MPAVNPGPASSQTPNIVNMLEAQGIPSNALNPTFAQLPAANTVPAGTSAYTSDQGEVISNGTVWAYQGFPSTVGVSRVLFQSGMPMMIVPTGSAVSAVGAVTLGTTLPIAAGSCYGYFPANYLGTQQPTAGWYYCTITNSTHILAYQNVFPGTPVVPSVLVPWSGLSGGTPTGSTGAQTISYSVPANVMGVNGELEVKAIFSFNSSASNKVFSLAFGSLSGPTQTATTTTSSGVLFTIRNSGATNVQITNLTFDETYAAATQVLGYGAVDTTTAQNLVFTLNNALAADFLILNGYSVKVYPA